MTTVRGPIAQFIAEHHGVIDRRRLMDFGLSRSGVDRLLASGQLRRIHASVYFSPAHLFGLEAALAAACMAHNEVVASDRAAGRLWDLRRMGIVTPQVVVPRGRGPRLAGVTVRRSRLLEPEDVVTREDGIRVTSPPRTAFDLAAVLDDSALESVLEQTIDQYCSYGALVRVLDRLGAAGRPGAARFARVLSARPAERRASDSGVTIHIDLALVRERVAVEVDHSYWHGTASAAHRDKERDRLLSRLDWHPVRVTELDVTQRLESVVGDIGAIALLRRAR